MRARRHERLDLVLDQLPLGIPVQRRGLHRAEDVETDPGPGAGGVDRHVRAVAELPHSLRGDPGGGEAVLPRIGGVCRQLIRGHSSTLSLGLVHPRSEVGGGEIREVEQQVPHVPLRVEDEAGNPAEKCLLQDRDSEAGLARPGHPYNGSVGGEVGAVEDEGLFGRFDLETYEQVALFDVHRRKYMGSGPG